MPTFKEDPAHLTHLALQFRTLATRSETARHSAIGLSDFGSGNAHDPALNDQINWFYRRWVMRVEKETQYMLQAAENLGRARETYKLVDHSVRKSAQVQEQSRRRIGL